MLVMSCVCGSLYGEMNIQEISDLYAKSPQVAALARLLEDKSVKTVFLQGLVASAAPMMFASVSRRTSRCVFLS